jgi:hypothetical protein
VIRSEATKLFWTRFRGHHDLAANAKGQVLPGVDQAETGRR